MGRVFFEAADMLVAERRAFVARACAADEALAIEVVEGPKEEPAGIRSRSMQCRRALEP